MKVCSKCKENKPLHLFFKNRSRKDGYHHACKAKSCNLRVPELIKAASKRYYDRNIDKIKERDRAYRVKNSVQIDKRNYAYQLARAKTDPSYRAIRNARLRVSNFLRQRNKFSKSLGCSYKFFVNHLEAQFQPGMTWENYGEWHIDHIYPLSVAYLEGPVSFGLACNFRNLQPLWAKENLSKGAKVHRNLIEEDKG